MCGAPNRIPSVTRHFFSTEIDEIKVESTDSNGAILSCRLSYERDRYDLMRWLPGQRFSLRLVTQTERTENPARRFELTSTEGSLECDGAPLRFALESIESSVASSPNCPRCGTTLAFRVGRLEAGHSSDIWLCPKSSCAFEWDTLRQITWGKDQDHTPMTEHRF